MSPEEDVLLVQGLLVHGGPSRKPRAPWAAQGASAGATAGNHRDEAPLLSDGAAELRRAVELKSRKSADYSLKRPQIDQRGARRIRLSRRACTIQTV